MSFCPYVPRLLFDLGKIRYMRGFVANEHLWVSWKSAHGRAYFFWRQYVKLHLCAYRKPYDTVTVWRAGKVCMTSRHIQFALFVSIKKLYIRTAAMVRILECLQSECVYKILRPAAPSTYSVFSPILDQMLICYQNSTLHCMLLMHPFRDWHQNSVQIYWLAGLLSSAACSKQSTSPSLCRKERVRKIAKSNC